MEHTKMDETLYKKIVDSFTRNEAEWFLAQTSQVQLVYFNFKRQIEDWKGA
tara:strand:- start:170 stop:322 length:153 start_codon:yes stop_codon:yes gene_type:complete